MTLTRAQRQHRSSIQIRTFLQLIDLLMAEPVTKRDVMAKLGLQSGTVSKWFKLLGDPTQEGSSPNKKIYIEDWLRPDRGNYAPIWRWGLNMPDKPRPPPMTAKQYQERYNLRKRGMRPTMEMSRKK